MDLAYVIIINWQIFPALTMEMKSKELLKIKVTLLRSRTWMVAAKSAAVGTVPIPGVTAVYDVAVIEAEVRHQRKQLGIDDENLKFIAENLGVDVDELKERIRVKIGANADLMELLSGKTLDSFLVRLMGQPLTAEALNTAKLTLSTFSASSSSPNSPLELILVLFVAASARLFCLALPGSCWHTISGPTSTL